MADFDSMENLRHRQTRGLAIAALALVAVVLAGLQYLVPSSARDQALATRANRAPTPFSPTTTQAAASLLIAETTTVAQPTTDEPPLRQVVADPTGIAGRLAFVSQGRLYVIGDGRTVQIDDLNGASPSRRIGPAWSPSGRWLAYWSSLPGYPGTFNEGNVRISDGASPGAEAIPGINPAPYTRSGRATAGRCSSSATTLRGCSISTKLGGAARGGSASAAGLGRLRLA